MYQTTTVELTGIGVIVIKTEDFLEPGYQLRGSETVTTLPDGRWWGTRPEDGDTPAEMHAHCCQPDVIRAGINHLDGIV